MSETTPDTETPYCQGHQQEAGRQQIPFQLDGVQGNLMLTLAAHNSSSPPSQAVGGTPYLTEDGRIASAFLSLALFVVTFINLIPWLISPQNNVCLYKSILHGKTANARAFQMLPY